MKKKLTNSEIIKSLSLPLPENFLNYWHVKLKYELFKGTQLKILKPSETEPVTIHTGNKKLLKQMRARVKKVEKAFNMLIKIARQCNEGQGFVGHPYILRSNMLGQRGGGDQNPEPKLTKNL